MLYPRISFLMAHRINIVLEDSNWNELQKLPRGQRSRLVNLAIANIVKLQEREQAVKRLEVLRKKMPKVSTKQILSWIKEARASN